MTLSPVHLGAVQRGPVHLTACGVLSRLVTMHPSDTTCPECRAQIASRTVTIPGHIPNCSGSGVIGTGRRGEVRYCACIHPRALTRAEVAARLVQWAEEDAARYDGK